jgi:hypothetical protein
LDNDTIQYIFDWDDTNTTSSGFFPNGTGYTANHKWTTAGIYTIKVKAFDNQTVSGTAELNVLIDTKYVMNIGYLIDSTGDGTYTTFFSNSTGKHTNTEKLNDGSYLLDNNNDGEWDYKFDIATGQLFSYLGNYHAESENSITTILLTGLVIVIILFVVILIFFEGKNKGKK